MDFYKCLRKSRGDFIVYMYVLYQSLGSGSFQCSETHRDLCFRDIEGLENVFQMMEKANTELNVTSMEETCIIFQEIKNCTEEFLDLCEADFLVEMGTIDSLYSALCDNIKDYKVYQPCYSKYKVQYHNCDKQRTTEVSDYIQKVTTIDDVVMCRFAYDHFVCVYETTYLGCSREAADVVRKMLNSTVTSLLLIAGIKCVLPDPPDIQITTTPTTYSSEYPISSTTEKIYVTTIDGADLTRNQTLQNHTVNQMTSTVSSSIAIDASASTQPNMQLFFAVMFFSLCSICAS